MNDDHKLLEKAANAAGVPIYASDDGTLQQRPIWAVKCGGGNGTMPYEQEWNPLRDDAEAFRLAVKLRIEIGFSGNGMQTWAVQPYKDIRVHEHIATNADLSAATRRAIVRAAASIGE